MLSPEFLEYVIEELGGITEELFDLEFTEEGSVGQRVNSLRHQFIEFKYDIQKQDKT